ncbi:zinc-ribbon domain-containing protein, partial [Fibrobacter sp.]|uniref:zinc ribbon domain-containing protein n=1 Tax=Fibrobacter sp. TaxID=35828 RepID=UPI003890A2A7
PHFTPHTIMLCPHCHSELKDNATFCPHCGSDADTGWKDGAEFTDLETPDYDEILENEFGTDEYGNKKKKANPLAIAAAVIVALAFVAAMLF